LQWLAVTSRARAVACLANLQNASKQTIITIVEALEKLEVRMEIVCQPDY
jgi:hypothetical protein